MPTDACIVVFECDSCRVVLRPVHDAVYFVLHRVQYLPVESTGFTMSHTYTKPGRIKSIKYVRRHGNSASGCFATVSGSSANEIFCKKIQTFMVNDC